MKKITAVGIAFFFVFFAFISCAKKPAAPKAGSAKAEDMLTLIPKAAIGIFVIDVNRVMTTEAASKAIKEDANYQKYQEFISETGIDPMKDVYFLVAAMTGEMSATGGKGVAVINLKYDKDRLLAKINEKQENLKESEHEGVTVFTVEEAEDGKPASGAFLDESNIVIGDDQGVKAVIDIWKKKADNVLKNEALSALIKTTNKEALLWSAIAFPEGAMKQLSAQNPMLQSLENLTAITMFFDYKNKNILAEIKAMGGDEANNKQIADLLSGLKAMGAMASTKDPNVGELMNRIEISAGADYVKISASLPEDLLEGLSKKATKEKEEEKEEGF